MSRKTSSILCDTRYEAFCLRYRHNLLRYIVENSRRQITWQQLEVIKDIQEPGSQVAIASGHGTGKSWLFAWLIDWHLRTYPSSNCLLTATNITQARTGVWKYLDEVQADILKNYPWQAGHFVKEATRYFNVHFKDSWYCFTKTAPKNAASNIAGQHADWYMCIVDEAAEVADEIHGVLRGALTDERNRYIMASQPMKATGHFAEALTTLKGVIYKAHILNAEESPIVSKKFIRSKLIEYGGHHSPEYQIKVLGCLPDNLAGMLIPRAWFDIAMKIKLDMLNWGWVITADIAEGKFRDSSVWSVARVCGYGADRLVEVVEIFESLDLDEIQFANRLYNRAMELPNCTVAVDGDGAGRTVILHLQGLGMGVEEIHWGLYPFAETDKRRYRNLRAYSSLKAREAIFEERMKLPNNKKLVEQGTKIPYELKEGRYVIMPKDQMRSKGIKSPDIFDTICFFFLVDYVPVGDAQADAAQNAVLAEALKALQIGDGGMVATGG